MSAKKGENINKVFEKAIEIGTAPKKDKIKRKSFTEKITEMFGK